jgi:DNA repair protein RadC
MILGHNHPSGSTRPSRDDERITSQITKAGELLNIRVLDHIIYTREHFYSFNDEGRI